MSIFMLFLGAFGAGVFFLLRDGPEYLTAESTGRLRTRGYRPVVVDRTAEPERFEKLMKGRRGGLWLGVAALAGGLVGMAIFAFMLIADQS